MGNGVEWNLILSNGVIGLLAKILLVNVIAHTEEKSFQRQRKSLHFDERL